MSIMAIHVIANGDLFREAFNAIVTVLGSSTFQTAIRLAVLFSILGAACSYIKKNDLAVLAKWFILYFVVTVIILGPKIDVEIIDSGSQGAGYNVDNVPFGLAFPASMITSIAHALVSTMEDAFHMPDDAQYSKTGMLFGSRIFKLSTGFHLTDPDTIADFNAYVKNCVSGDILINKKYSMSELVNSQDIWSTITRSPSPVRGILFHDGTFQTCAAATPLIKKAINDDVQNTSFKFFGTRIFGGEDPNVDAAKLKQYLQTAYNYYASLSQTASGIMTQNILTNAIRNGVISYNASSGATASLLNLSSTQAMERMRMGWATSHNLATYVLPIMQVDILLLMLCLFPIIVLLTLQPTFGPRVFKHYIYSLIWIESWPILFSCLNLAVTFYIHNKAGGLAKGGLTLSNSNQLALEHSDVANMAGYLMTCVPFIAIGIVRGMAFAFSNAANYIGGMVHSAAAGAANEAISGNLSLGNTSYGNVNANKFDTNSTHMHGMATEQLANGATVTHTASGNDVWNATPGISHLAVSTSANQVASASLSEHAEVAHSAAIQDQASYNNAISDASSKLEHFNQSMSSTHGDGTNFASGQSASAAQHASELYGLVNNVAERSGVTWNEAFRGMSSFKQGAGGSVGISTPGGKLAPLNAGGSVSAGFDHSRSSDESMGHDVGTHLNVSHEEMQRFNQDWSAVESFNTTNHAENGNSAGATQLAQVAADFREAKTASDSYSSNFSDSERLSSMANFSEQHSALINSNFAQGFSKYVENTVPEKAATLLSATGNNAGAVSQLGVLAHRYINSSEFMGQIDSMYKQGSSGINPSQMYQVGSSPVSAVRAGLKAEYQSQAQGIKVRAAAHGAVFDAKNYNGVQQQVRQGQQNVNARMQTEKAASQSDYNSAKNSAHEEIKEGAVNADKGVIVNSFYHASIKPNYIKKEDS